MKRLHTFGCICVFLATMSIPVLGGAKKISRDTWQQPARVVEDLGLKDGTHIADIGCGTGYFVFRLSKALGENGRVYATEINAKSLKALSGRVEKEKITNIKPVLSEATNTKLEDNCLDAALICNVLHHVPKDKRLDLTRDIVRSIKPGGYLYIIDWKVKATVKHDKTRRIKKEDLVKYATDCGLKLDAEFHYLVQQVFLRFRKPLETGGEKAEK